VFYQFNAIDQGNLTDTSVIQVILINKQQRVKLVVSQPIEKVLVFQDELQKFISNLTDFKAFIDRISVHRSDEGEELDERGRDFFPIKNPPPLFYFRLNFRRIFKPFKTSKIDINFFCLQTKASYNHRRFFIVANNRHILKKFRNQT
jgi:hypothetical protein